MDCWYKDVRKCFKCNRMGHEAKDCKSRGFAIVLKGPYKAAAATQKPEEEERPCKEARAGCVVKATLPSGLSDKDIEQGVKQGCLLLATGG